MESHKTYIRNLNKGGLSKVSFSNEQSGQSGFTLVEILVVIAIIAILAGFTGLMGIDSYRGYSFRGERDNLVSLLQKARGQAMSNTCGGGTCTGGEPHGVAYMNGHYVLFQGASLDNTPANASFDQIISPTYPISISFNPSNVNSVVFKQLSGDALSNVVITISDNYNHSSNISINTEGRISWTH